MGQIQCILQAIGKTLLCILKYSGFDTLEYAPAVGGSNIVDSVISRGGTLTAVSGWRLHHVTKLKENERCCSIYLERDFGRMHKVQPFPAEVDICAEFGQC